MQVLKNKKGKKLKTRRVEKHSLLPGFNKQKKSKKLSSSFNTSLAKNHEIHDNEKIKKIENLEHKATYEKMSSSSMIKSLV